MSTILCVAATHLTKLRPDNHSYALASGQLLSKSLQLVRENLSRPFDSRGCCDGLAGVTVLINYISWCRLDFLDGQRDRQDTPRMCLDVSQDPLLLLSPGVIQVFLRSLPVFVAEQSVFLRVGQQHPRVNIEDHLASQGLRPTKYVEPFMRLWADPHYQAHGSPSSAARDGLRKTWDFFFELESEYATREAQHEGGGTTKSSVNFADLATYEPKTPEENSEILLTVSDSMNRHKCTMGDGGGSCSLDGKPSPEADSKSAGMSSEDQQRLSYERVARRLSPILCCLEARTMGREATGPLRADMQRFLFAFPLLCCGPMIEMGAAGDTRAYVILYHFYRAARILLAQDESWWACERSRIMEGLLLSELKARGVSCCLRI